MSISKMEYDWMTWSPREAISPDFSRKIEDDIIELKMDSHNFTNYGVWYCYIYNVEENYRYSFNVDYYAANIERDSESVYALVSWIDKNKIVIQRDYIHDIENLKDGWRHLYRNINAPEGADSAKLELGLRWAGNGSVTWRNPTLSQIPSAPQRNVRIATTYLPPYQDISKNVEAMVDAVDNAGRNGADIVCFTETYCSYNVKLPIEKLCQPIPGKTTHLISETAKRNNMYVIVSIYEQDEEGIYNTAILIGRKGEIVGKYRKIHIPLYEGELGVTPGTECNVFDTDIGKIGIMICWDQVFPEVAGVLRDKGADIVFLPTHGDEVLQQRARARDNGLYLVVAGTKGPESSRIINPMGEIIGNVKEGNNGICIVDIDVDRKYYTYWLSVGPSNGEPKSLFKKEKRSCL